MMKTKLTTFCGLFLLCGFLFAAEPIAIQHFGEIEGRVLGSIQKPENKGDLVYSLNTVRTESEDLMYLSSEGDVAVVQILAASGDQTRRFMVRFGGEEETLLDLSELAGFDALMMLSRDRFYATLVDGDQLRSLQANTLVYPGRNEAIDPPDELVQAKTQNKACTPLTTFFTLTCATPSTCGTLSFFNFGEVRNDCPFSGYQELTWGCHYGFDVASTPNTISTNSSCGCFGFAYWELDFNNNVWLVSSRCPSDPNFSVYFVL